MSRASNRAVMGFFAIGEKHHEAMLSLIAPSTTPEARILDPFAGEGDFLLKASTYWNLTPTPTNWTKRGLNCASPNSGRITPFRAMWNAYQLH